MGGCLKIWQGLLENGTGVGSGGGAVFGGGLLAAGPAGGDGGGVGGGGMGWKNGRSRGDRCPSIAFSDTYPSFGCQAGTPKKRSAKAANGVG
jgi:hypothetical protein